MPVFIRSGGRSKPVPARPSSPSSSPDSKISTPVLERTRTVTETTIKAQPARTARDKLLKFMSDGRYHSAYSLDRFPGLAQGDWVVLLREIMAYGYGFGRRGNSLILRERSLSEKPQDLWELLQGIEVRIPENLNPKRLSSSSTLEEQAFFEDTSGLNRLSEEETFEPSSDQNLLPALNDRLIVSADSSACVIPAKSFVTSTMAILAQKRQGKTYLAMVLAEELSRHGLPFVVIDPTGVWYGLRATASGLPSSHEILTLGGPAGEVPILASDGAKVAELINDIWPLPVILDFVDLPPEGQHEFVADFGSRLYTINKNPVHIFFDEADEFMPQQSDSSYKHQRRCLNVVDRLIRRGGVKGIGATLITQRSAVINKNVLSQVGRLKCLKMVSPHDLEAVEGWMKSVVESASDRFGCLAAIPRLSKGEVFSIQNEQGATPLVRYMVRAKTTYDSSRTPTMDDINPQKPELSHPPADVIAAARSKLGGKFPETSEELVGDPDWQDDGTV